MANSTVYQHLGPGVYHYYRHIVGALVMVALLVLAPQPCDALERFIWNERDAPLVAAKLPPVEGLGMPSWDSESLQPGQTHVINVFASWCEPCRAEHEALMTIAATDGLTILGVAIRDAAEPLNEWFAEAGNPYTAIAHDWEKKWFDAQGIEALPESLVVIGGRIRYHWQGPLTAEAVEALVELLPAK